jgi:hypothetical protein
VYQEDPPYEHSKPEQAVEDAPKAAKLGPKEIDHDLVAAAIAADPTAAELHARLQIVPSVW